MFVVAHRTICVLLPRYLYAPVPVAEEPTEHLALEPESVLVS